MSLGLLTNVLYVLEIFHKRDDAFAYTITETNVNGMPLVKHVKPLGQKTGFC